MRRGLCAEGVSEPRITRRRLIRVAGVGAVAATLPGVAAAREISKVGSSAVVSLRRSRLAGQYARLHPSGWAFGPKRLSSLRDLAYSASLLGVDQGPLVEIADLVVSAVTRWPGARSAAHKGRSIPELGELAVDCRSLRDLFPSRPSTTPPRWQGYSFITFTANRTGKEFLYDNVDGWLRELPEPPS
jgi:hypothetical protein